MLVAMAVPVFMGLELQFTPLVLLVIVMGIVAHICWFWYGSILNDYHDQEIDRHHPFGEKMFTRGYFSDKEKRQLVRTFAFISIMFELPQVAYIAFTHTHVLVDLVAFGVLILVGYAMATAYSAPPLRTRRKLLGATYTLMFVFVIAFLRFCMVLGGWGFVWRNIVYITGICVFIFLSHGITTVALKDIPDAFSDKLGGVRSVPLVRGFRAAMSATMAVLVMTMGLGVFFVLIGWVQWWFLVTYIGVLSYVYLFRDMNDWIENVGRDPDYWRKVQMRKTHHMLGYLVNWGVWIPCFLLAFDSNLLF